jgi:hypothetical protein
MPSALWSSLATAEIPAGRSRECLNFSYLTDRFTKIATNYHAMTTNLSKYKSDLDKLVALGRKMHLDLVFRHRAEVGKLSKEHQEMYEKVKDAFEDNYQAWYTEAGSVIRQLIPDRLSEFQELYKGDGKRKTTEPQTYHIQDWLNGVRANTAKGTADKIFNDLAIVSLRFNTQTLILSAVQARFKSSLFDIKQLVQADLFDSELDAARELSKNGFHRAAGAVAGVVLEKHLGQVVANHAIATKKQHPTISDFNDLLKNGAILDVPAWRNIQRLGDLRNLCDHSKHRDPTKEEIAELIDGVDKITKTLF